MKLLLINKVKFDIRNADGITFAGTVLAERINDAKTPEGTVEPVDGFVIVEVHAVKETLHGRAGNDIDIAVHFNMEGIGLCCFFNDHFRLIVLDGRKITKLFLDTVQECIEPLMGCCRDGEDRNALIPDMFFDAFEILLGTGEIPVSLIAGTKTAGRQSALDREFYPLLEEDSEFASKWISLMKIQVEEGFRDPVKVYEYRNRFYVQEGNKRVSIMKVLGMPEILAEVTRVLPAPENTPEDRCYREFLKFHKTTGIWEILFSRPGSYEKLLGHLGKGPEEAWSDEEIRDLKSVYYRFTQGYSRISGQQRPETMGDAFLRALTVYPYETMLSQNPSELGKGVKSLKQELDPGSLGSHPVHVMEPEKLVYETVTEDVPDADEAGAVSMTFRVFGDHAELVACSGEGRETLVIPDTFRELPVTAIRYDFDAALAGMFSSHWTKVVIPESVSSVDTEFFTNFYSLEEIETGEGNADFKSVDGVLFDKKGETLLLYPCSKKDAEYTVPDKTERIEEKAFYLNDEITIVTLPKSLRTIGKNAFSGCSSLSDARFGKGLKVIEDRAFNGSPLQNVKIPASVTSIGAAAFTVGEGFGSVELPEKLESLGYHAFSCNYEETFTQDSIRIPARLVIKNQFLDGILFDNYEVDEKSENYAAVEGLLMSKDGRTLVSVPTLREGDLIIPEETLYIEYNALDGCDRITDIYLPDSILDLGNVGKKDYDTGEYCFTIHCKENSEAQRRLDAKGIPWEAW